MMSATGQYPETRIALFQRKEVRRDEELSKGWGQIATPLAIATAGGPQSLNCATTEGLRAIPSAAAIP